MERDTYFVEMKNLDEASEIHKAYSEYKKEFSTEVASAVQADTADEKVARLWQVVNASVKQDDGSEIKQTDMMDSGQFMLVFNHFRNIGRFQDMIDLFDRCPNKDFTEATLVRELLALAYIKTDVPEKALDLTNDLIERARTPFYTHSKRADKDARPVRLHATHEALKNAQEKRVAVAAARRRVSSTTFEMQGRAYRLLADKENDAAKKKALLEKSAKSFEDGFEATLDAGVGLMALHRNIELGKTEKAEKEADLVYLAALRDGAAEMRLINGEEKLTARDFSLLNTALQAAILSGKGGEEMQALAERLERCPARRWQLNDLAESLTLIAEKHPSKHLNKLLETLRQKEQAHPIATVMEPLLQNAFDIPDAAQVNGEDQAAARKEQIAALKAKARQIAPDFVQNNVFHSGNPYMLSHALRLGAVLSYDEKTMDMLRQSFIESQPPHWMIGSTQKFLNAMASKIADPNSPASERIAKQAAYLEELIPSSEKQKTENQEKLDALYATTYSYRGLASRFEGTSRVSGNMQFGGQLPDHAVSKKDLELFSGLLAMPLNKLMPEKMIPQSINGAEPLNKVKDVDAFLTAADAFVRYHFGTDNFAGYGFSLEDNALMCGKDGLLKNTEGAELQHGSLYDQTVDGMIHVCGKQKGKKENAGIDSRTNISAIFLLGMGDCRHHAQVKQILFDMWQKKQMNDTLRTALHATREGNAPAHDAAVRKFDQMYRTELRTTDVKVNMPVVMEQESDDKGNTWDRMYRPELTADKKFVKKDCDTTLEEHTMTVLMQRDENGELKKFDLRDAFYQHTYEWGNKNISPDDIALENGKPKVAVGSLNKSEVLNGEDVPVHLVPTNYNTGRRDTAVNDSTGEDVCVMGIRVSGLESPARFAAMLRNRDGVVSMLHEVLRTEQTVYQPRQDEMQKQETQKSEPKNYTSAYASMLAHQNKGVAPRKTEKQAPAPQKKTAAFWAVRKDRTR